MGFDGAPLARLTSRFLSLLKQKISPEGLSANLKRARRFGGGGALRRRCSPQICGVESWTLSFAYFS